MHVVTLVWADPNIIGDGVVGEVGGELAEVDNVGYARRVGLQVLVADERI